MGAKVYLQRTMLHRLLACLAFITGLVAVGSPAEARLVVGASQQVQVVASSLTQGTQALPCPGTQQKVPVLGKAVVPAGCKPKPVIIYIPTVQLGPDRARE